VNFKDTLQCQKVNAKKVVSKAV